LVRHPLPSYASRIAKTCCRTKAFKSQVDTIYETTSRGEWLHSQLDRSKENAANWTAERGKGLQFQLERSKENVANWIDESAPAHDRPKERVSSIVSLSSTGSGGDYSVTDDSEFEEHPDDRHSMFSKATLTTIELVMRKIEINLNYVAYIQCAGGQSSKSRGTGEASTGRRGSIQASSGKRKSRDNEPLLPDDQGDDGPNKRRRVSITTTEDSEIGPRFACPFYKHDPNRYRNRRTCPGPGWPTVHRMK
jgi:hypothetical protein